MCVDNCPEYELPNVITINGDGVNDFFKPIKNKFIKSIDLKSGIKKPFLKGEGFKIYSKKVRNAKQNQHLIGMYLFQYNCY